MKFSQRNGFIPASKAIQTESIDQDLKTALWNVIYLFVFENGDLNEVFIDENEKCKNISISIFHNKFKLPLDSIPQNFYKVVALAKDFFMKSKWFEIYDYVEYFIDIFKDIQPNDVASFIFALNKNLEKEVSGYRIINKRVSPITSEIELNAIDEAISNSENGNGVYTHLTASLRMLSDRSNPDYRNSIKESISAVEAFCKKVADGKAATLADALKILERKSGLHPALKSSFSSLYGFTNDSSGIRHAIMECQRALQTKPPMGTSK